MPCLALSAPGSRTDLVRTGRFGGGSNMLDGEKNDFWEMFDDVVRSVTSPCSRRCSSDMRADLQRCSISTFLGHVPWLGIYLGYIPSFSANIRAFIDYCAQQVQRRIKHGSVKKDLFHYLVSLTALR